MHLEDSFLEDWCLVERPEPEPSQFWARFLPTPFALDVTPSLGRTQEFDSEWSPGISQTSLSCSPTLAAGTSLVRTAGLAAQLRDAIDATSVVGSRQAYDAFTTCIPPLDEEDSATGEKDDMAIKSTPLQYSGQRESVYGLDLACSSEFHKYTPCIVDLSGSITIKKLVARGGYSSVYLAIWKGERVALKALRITIDKPHTFERRLSREILVLSSLDHPNVTPLYGFATTILSELPAIVTPWYANGSADKYLPRHMPSIAKRWKLCMDITNGLLYLHTLKPIIVHGDLKPSNILIDDLGTARLCDFGLASLLCEEAGSGFTTTTEYLGTPRYAAPEIFNRSTDTVGYKPTPASDIFSLGCVIYEFITGNTPYPHRRSSPYLAVQILSDIMRRQPPARPSHALENLDLGCRASELWSLLDHCWDFDPALRPSAMQVEEELAIIRTIEIG